MKKVAIVTGASGGLGRELLKNIIDDIDEVWAVGRNLSKLEALKTDDNFNSEKIVPLQIDLSEIKNLDKLSEKLKSEGGDFSVRWLINNAGAGRFAPSEIFSTEELSANITMHCTAMAAICNICIPYMSAGCNIVNIASQSAFLPLPYMNLYASTKSFIYSYTRSLRVELKDKGIKVTAVCPGWIKTPLLPESLNGKKVNFPFIATADKVAIKAIKDARRGKAISIYKFAVRYVTFLQRHMSQTTSIKIWTNAVKKFVPEN